MIKPESTCCKILHLRLFAFLMHLFILSHLNNIAEAILVLRHLLHCDELNFLLLVLFFGKQNFI